LQLQHDVALELTPASPKNGKNAHVEPVAIRGARMEFDRDARRLYLGGPADATTTGSQLRAGNIAVELDESFRARRIVANSGGSGIRPELHSKDPKGERTLDADAMTATLSAEGKIAGIGAEGNVTGSAESVDEKEEMASSEANLEFWPVTGRPKEITLKGAAKVHTANKKTGDVRELQSEAVRMNFSGAAVAEKSRPQMTETLARGTLVWTNGNGKGAGAGEQTKLQADRFHLDFGALGKARLLQANGNVHVERNAPGKGTQTATGKSGVAQLEASGGWSQMEMQGQVRLKDAEKSGQADNVVFVRAAQSVMLTGHAQMR